MSRKCAKCGTVSEIEEAFQKSYYSDKFYCPACYEKEMFQYGGSFLKACAIVLIGGIIWVTAAPENELAWLMLQAGLAACLKPVLE
jgi:hypothetical protein